ncbi:MAG: hemerythrin domain-containing protein [Deltaproteobacteria bacterium]|nr:hemerythrin domain-containing protein [Deltaproteobacteria bacterium]
MKRDPRFHGLSTDHHHALVLARSLCDGRAPWTADGGARLGRRFDSEIEPHFRIEEDVLLPALRSLGRESLVVRVLTDHGALRAAIEAARAGDESAARAFAQRLIEHVRFEERELFSACEESLPDDVLDELGRRAPIRR